jgi:hypothetical protein
METLKHGDIETPTLKHNKETWRRGTWREGNMETWKHGDVDIKT